MRLVLLFLSMINVSFALEWSEGLNEVAKNNPELLSAKNLLQASMYQVNVQESTYMPKVVASAGKTHASSTNLTTNSMGITATENLFSGFSDLAKIKEANLARDNAEINLKTIKAKVSYDYKFAFANLLFAEKFVKLANDIIKRREANLKLVQLRFESGRENIGSLHLSKAYLADAKYVHLIASNGLGVAQSELAKVLGRDDESRLEISGSVPVNAPTNALATLSFKDLALNSLEYQKAQADEKISKENLNISKSSFYPSFNLTQSLTRANYNGGSWNHSLLLGAELTFPLFSGGRDYYTYKSSAETYRASALSKKNIHDQTIIRLKDAFTKYIESAEKLNVDLLFVDAGVARERIAKEKYNNGLLTFDEWDIIENDLIGRQKALVQTEKERIIAEALWEQVQGKGVLP